MAHNFFLSHFTDDKEIAEIIAQILSRLSLRQIAPWYSSDNSGEGGLKPGNIWFNEILRRISQSKVLISVLTPNSIRRPWIYFESGIAQSLENCELIPVCVGLKRDNVIPPLGLYQCYQLTDYKSLKEFTSKILTKFEIQFDEGLAKPLLKDAISNLSKIKFTGDENHEPDQAFNNALAELKTHIDKRFIDLLSKQPGTSPANLHAEQTQEAFMFTITINVQFPNLQGKQFVEVRADDTVQDVLDNMYYLLKDHIEEFTYMQDWILLNPKTGQRMIIREIANMVPAKAVFRPEIEWDVIKLQSEYTASSSKKIVMSFYK